MFLEIALVFILKLSHFRSVKQLENYVQKFEVEKS